VRHWSLGHVSGFELFGCAHLHARAHWLGKFACKYLAQDEEHAKDKDLAATWPWVASLQAPSPIAERWWIFFTQAKHPQNLHYQAVG
jgi:hypothetical protein